VEYVDNESITGAFRLGLYIDNIPVACISALAVIFACLISFWGSSRKIFRYSLNIYYISIYTVIFGFTIADIPYFNFFFKHLDVSILAWLSNDTEGYQMILAESSYYKYFALFFITVLLFGLCVVYFSKKWKNYNADNSVNSKLKLAKYILISIALLAVCYTGVTKKQRFVYPITLWTPYLGSSSFTNELTVSPVYNFWLSMVVPQYKDREVNHLISLDDSFELIKKDFGYQDFIEDDSRIRRRVTSDKEEIRPNIVLVIMEAMSSYFITETPHLTPTLNELINKSYYFRNIYSQAIHTNQGTFSSLYGIPSLFDRVIMDNRVATGGSNAVPLPLCEGLPYNLNKKGYVSSFYLAHEKAYNNMDMFFSLNGYEMKNLHSRENYPPSEYVSPWGVNDGYLFKYAVNTLGNNDGQPFFGGILTISNHPDYIIPDEFKYVSKNDSEQAVFYSDQCIKQFMDDAAKHDWFDNTIFVFVADHGRLEGQALYEMPLSFNHVPLIIYSPLFEDAPKIIDTYGGQIDIFPTVMGLLNMDYENNSLGIDLMKETRPYAVFSSDDKLGCIDDNFLYCYNTLSKQEYLYDYKANNPQNVASVHSEAFDSMRVYASATVQVTNYLLKNQLLRKKEDEN
jgi:phosphoglycerol transferase MdoB-like AlkP superfamily enzyme